MWRLVRTCCLSLVLYWVVFGWVVERPLSLGILRDEMLQKTVRMEDMPSPKLVILAGSNGPYSHSCVVLNAMLHMPCENAGIAVGIGLDDLFARYGPLLKPGDIVYMPMELQQYTESARAYAAGVDGEFLLRHDRKILAGLPWWRQLGAGFCCALADLIEASVETPIADHAPLMVKDILKSEYNMQGDRVDNDLSARDEALLAGRARRPPSAAAISKGYGARLIAEFVATQTRKGVIVIGGLPVDYMGVHLSSLEVKAIAHVYTANGGAFAVLQDHSHYPRADFFNGEDHLAKPCQYLHSIFVAQRLAVVLHIAASPASVPLLRRAGTCPSATFQLASD